MPTHSHPPSTHPHPFPFLPLLLGLLLFKALLTLFFIHSEMIGLGPDEAQYWTWSQSLDWGYYSKPPGIAWQIWLGTKLFGNTELGVRFASVWLNFALSLSVYALARASHLAKQTAFWAALCMAFSPLGIAGSFLATTDGGLALFWTLSCIILAKALASKTPPHYFLLGLAIFGGALFKWPIYYFWVFILGGTLWLPTWRQKTVFLALFLSFLGLMPSLIWNQAHDWATFKHVFTTILGGHAQGHAQGTHEIAQKWFKGNFWEFLGAQALLVSPIFFILMLKSFFSLLQKQAINIPLAIRFCGLTSFATLIVFSLMACFQKMQGNWCAFIYPPAFAALAWQTLENPSSSPSKGKKWLYGGLYLSLVLVFVGVSFPLVELTPYSMSPFRHNLGWKTLQKELEEAGYDPQRHFLFSDKYQTTSLLSFYGPEQKRAYFLNLQGARKNQFSYWPSLPEEQTGQDGFFIVVENAPHLKNLEEKGLKSYLKQLSPYFKKVEFLGMKPLIIQKGQIVKGALIYRGVLYNGKLPNETEKY